MKVANALEEIEEAVHNHIGSWDGSVRDTVKPALEAVESIVGSEGVDELTRSVSGHIRDHESRPAPKQVKDDAARIVNEKGHEVPEESSIAQSRM